jgi:hypothetical protein
MYDLSQVSSEKRIEENPASRLILEKWPQKSNGLTYQENLKNEFRFLFKVFLLPNFSFESLLSSSKSGGHAGASGLSTGGSREFDNQRKKFGLDFDLRKTCAKF